MAYKIEFSDQAEDDLFEIVDYLTESYRGFGENVTEALARAGRRQEQIREQAQRIATAPHRGERSLEYAPQLRHLTLNRMIYWFEVDEASETIRIIAVIFGAKDHLPAMQQRLLG